MSARQQTLWAKHSVNTYCVHTTVSLQCHHLIFILAALNTHILKVPFFDMLLYQITCNPLVGFGIQAAHVWFLSTTLSLPATNKAGVIAGAVIGALLLLLLLLLLIWLLFCCCHKRRYQKEVANEIRYFTAVWGICQTISDRRSSLTENLRDSAFPGRTCRPQRAGPPAGTPACTPAGTPASARWWDTALTMASSTIPWGGICPQSTNRVQSSQMEAMDRPQEGRNLLISHMTLNMDTPCDRKPQA